MVRCTTHTDENGVIFQVMSNDEAQMPNKAQSPDNKQGYFWHLSIWISTVIWILHFQKA
jgi:hypothetical protein